LDFGTEAFGGLVEAVDDGAVFVNVAGGRFNGTGLVEDDFELLVVTGPSHVGQEAGGAGATGLFEAEFADNGNHGSAPS